MKPSPFEYHRPRTIREALALLGSLPDAKVLAGGQSLMPMMAFRFLSPAHVVDLNEIPELAGIAVDGSRLRIGSMTRQRDIELSPVVGRLLPLLPEAYRLVAHKQIRNRGTLGGALCQLDPSSEQPCFTSVLDGVLTLARLDGDVVRSRTVAIGDWTQMYMTPDLQEGELLVDIALDVWPEGHGYAFEEYARRHGDFAIVGAAVVCVADAAGGIGNAAIALCGVGPGPVRLTAAEQAIAGRPMDEDAIRLVTDEASAIDAMADEHITADYRRHLAATLTGRALRRAFARSSGHARH